jgi:hypothetical protein
MMLIVYIVLFSCWYVCCILWQFEPIRKRLTGFRTINSFGLLPIWTFFAPLPGMSDTHMLYRDKLTDGSLTDWQEIHAFEKRKFYHFIWNPFKRNSKLIVDALSEVKKIKNNSDKVEMDEKAEQNFIKLSQGYLVLLNLAVKNSKVTDASRARQFVVLDSYWISEKREVTPIFISPFHTI